MSPFTNQDLTILAFLARLHAELLLLLLSLALAPLIRLLFDVRVVFLFTTTHIRSMSDAATHRPLPPADFDSGDDSGFEEEDGGRNGYRQPERWERTMGWWEVEVVIVTGKLPGESHASPVAAGEVAGEDWAFDPPPTWWDVVRFLWTGRTP